MDCSREAQIMKATLSSCLVFVKSLRDATGLRGVINRWLGGKELNGLILKLEQALALRCGP